MDIIYIQCVLPFLRLRYQQTYFFLSGTGKQFIWWAFSVVEWVVLSLSTKEVRSREIAAGMFFTVKSLVFEMHLYLKNQTVLSTLQSFYQFINDPPAISWLLFFSFEKRYNVFGSIWNIIIFFGKFYLHVYNRKVYNFV